MADAAPSTMTVYKLLHAGLMKLDTTDERRKLVRWFVHTHENWRAQIACRNLQQNDDVDLLQLLDAPTLWLPASSLQWLVCGSHSLQNASCTCPPALDVRGAGACQAAVLNPIRMVHGAWCMCMVHGAWCMVHGARGTMWRLGEAG